MWDVQTKWTLWLVALAVVSATLATILYQVIK